MKEYIVRYETEQIENSEFFYGGKVECELIRCKDCKWYYGDYCGGFGDGAFAPEYGFCHNAERKEE